MDKHPSSSTAECSQKDSTHQQPKSLSWPDQLNLGACILKWSDAQHAHCLELLTLVRMLKAEGRALLTVQNQDVGSLILPVTQVGINLSARLTSLAESLLKQPSTTPLKKPRQKASPSPCSKHSPMQSGNSKRSAKKKRSV